MLDVCHAGSVVGPLAITFLNNLYIIAGLEHTDCSNHCLAD